LIAADRLDEARKVLTDAHAGGDTSSELVRYEIAEIQSAINAETGHDSHYLSLFKGRGNRHRALITISLGFFSQWIGNGVVSYYLPQVLDTAGVTSVTDQLLISGCLQIWNLIFALVGAWAVEAYGRRKLFLTSWAIMIASYIVIIACTATFAKNGSKATGLVVVPFLYIFFAGYDIAM
jgi:hypothetical protein